MAVEGSSCRSYVELFVDEFPKEMDTFIVPVYQLRRSWHFSLSDGTIFKVNLKKDFECNFKYYKNDVCRDRGKIYFEVRGRTPSKEAILLMFRFLQLYNPMSGCAVSSKTNKQSLPVDKLEDIIRMRLLCQCCSEKKYSNVNGMLAELNIYLNGYREFFEPVFEKSSLE